MTPVSILGSAVVAALILLWAPPAGHTQPTTKVARVGVHAFRAAGGPP